MGGYCLGTHLDGFWLQSGTAKTAAHVDADGHSMFSAVIADRYHPVGEQVMPHMNVGANAEEYLQERAAVAAKWAGIKPDDILTGVREISTKIGGKMQKEYAIPIAIPVSSEAVEGEDGEQAPVAFKQQPLAWIAERNRAQFGDQMKVAQMADPVTGASVDHITLGEQAMQELVGATHATVFGNQAIDDLIVSAKALGAVTGPKYVNIGLRVDADVLNFMAN